MSYEGVRLYGHRKAVVQFIGAPSVILPHLPTLISFPF